MATFISNSPCDTERFGREFAQRVEKGSIIALEGDLGAGKTRFVKGLVAGLGSSSEVTSPTYTLVHEYPGRLSIYHFDFFRLEDRQAAERLGLDDYFYGDGVSVVEWADKFRDLLPTHAQWISFGARAENERIIVTK